MQSRRQWVGTDSRYNEITFEVLSSGKIVTQKVGDDDYAKLKNGTVFPVNVVRIFDTDRVTVGAGATITAVAHSLPAGATVSVIIVGLLLILSGKPWYLRDRLVETEPGKQVE